MKSLCAVLKVYGIKINDCEDNASDEFYVRALFCILECASGSVVEHRLAKARAAGSNPVSCFFYCPKFLVKSRFLGIFYVVGFVDRGGT